ncbi:Nucleoside-diphosphate-sugar epimerase [Arthrobacter sp. ov407]|uniref:NmrA family NAD(P)-binding protein n=1 Tax=Arthrobacter sp. ov407 TaxID=1761748 RepID=UPI0008868FDA|nr:NmrA family NAD(P)-binding protein [Arthrobacter sp. ov407]SDL27107.1 Nucleoside-diphosphate-sugar epimerase [Arthrobacter sp. ov407]
MTATTPPPGTVLLAGASGDLGGRILRNLVALGATVRVLTRQETGTARIAQLRAQGVEVIQSDYDDPDSLRRACTDVDCVVSAVNGLDGAMLGAQSRLLEAAVAAGVPRFIPSDFSIDYRGIRPRSNRNLQLRRDFAQRLDATEVRATSILSGAFTDMLSGQAPMILFSRHRVLFWSDPDQVLDFTTKDDTATYTAAAALDERAPRVLQVAGDQVTARTLASTMTDLTGTQFRLLYAGSVGSLTAMSRAVRVLMPATDEPFPPWQGMQYFASMFSGDANLRYIDNDRYGSRKWTTVRDVLEQHR